MGKIIACVNEKGGVAKTTTVKNLSVGLAMNGKKVLAVDLDPSANLTKAFGLRADPEAGSIVEVMDMTADLKDVPDGYGIVHQEEGIDLITSSNDLHALESKLSEAFQREIVLRRYIETLRGSYDYILLDCPAGLGIFVTNALFCADSLLIPLEPHKLAVEAMQNLFIMISKVRKLNGTGTKPEVMGTFFTKVRNNTSNDRNIMAMLREQSGSHVHFFDTFIPLMAKIPESDAASESIFKYAGKSAAALNFMDFVSEFLQMEEESQG